MTVVLKLGGSVITEKSERETVDYDRLNACSRAIAESGVDPILIHGAGSFGHYYAERYGLTATKGTDDPQEVLDVHASMERLDDHVLEALSDHGVRGLPVHPRMIAHRDEGGALHLPARQVATIHSEGFVPVLYGDLIPHEGKGFTVISGDEIVVSLANQLRADRVGLCSTVPGVLDSDGSVLPRIESYDDVAEVLGGSDGMDVTGGMAAKVRTLLDLGSPAFVFGPDELRSFLAGESVGTRIEKPS